jgi:hypothetical protein
MGWARFDDGYTDSPKIVEAGPWAELLDVRAIIYAAKHETDGLITRSALKLISRDIPKPLDRVHALVEVGRWSSNEGGGWWIHDYLDFNPSKAQKSDMRRNARERQAKYRSNAVTNTVTDGVSNASPLRGGESLQPNKQRVRSILRCETCGQLDIDCECVAS